MATLPPVSKTARVDLRMVKDGQQIENTFHFAGQAEWDQVSLQALADAVKTYFAGKMNKFVIGTSFQNVVARDLSSSAGEVAISPFAANTTGSAGSKSLPNSVTLAIKRQSVVGGRSGHGRVYIPGLWPEALVGVNEVSSAVITDQIALYAGLGAAIAAANINSAVEVLVSYYSNKAVRATPATYAIQNWSVSDTFIDNQRRRLPGRGR